MNANRNANRARRAFTLIEVLVALIMMGIASAGLAAALTDDRKLRDMSAAQVFAAGRARARIELLAALSCSPSASGTSVSSWASERWRASASQSAWTLTDSFALAGSNVPFVITARVACPD